MLLFLTRRVLLGIPTLFGLVLLIFLLIHAVPGDPAVVLAGDQATPRQVAAIRAQYGFDKPLMDQFAIYVSQLAHGSLGVSYLTQRPVARELADRLPATLELAFFAMTLAVGIGIPAGLLAAQRHNSWIDHTLRVLGIGGLAIASFWLAIMLQFIFSMNLNLLPVHGRLSLGMQAPRRLTGFFTVDALLEGRWSVFTDALRHLILPGVTLSIAPLATIMRFTRASVLAVLRRDFVLYERAMGYPRAILMTKYILRNALVTPITQIGLLLGAILGSAVVIEDIFDWPGLGSYAVQSIATDDYQATLGVVLVIGFLYILINIVVDFVHALIDRRLVEQL